MNRRKRKTGIALLLLLVLIAGGCGLWVRGQQRQYARNRQLIEALVNQDGKMALALVNEGADPNTTFEPTPLPSLVERVKQLFHRSPPTVNDSPTAFLMVCGALGYTDQSRAVSYDWDDAPLIQAMLKHRANVNAGSSLSTGGLTALMLAAVNQHRNTVRLLLEHGADVNAKDKDGYTPLMYAATNDARVVVNLLLEHGADVNAKDQYGQTPLICAAMDASSDMVRLLLQQGADVNAKDKWGVTALMYAKGHPATIALLQHARARK